MKKCFLFVAIACVLSVLSQAQVYNFPVRPGTETWSNLVTVFRSVEQPKITRNIQA